MTSLADRTGVSVVAGQVGGGLIAVVVADLIAGAAAVGCATRGSRCVCLFHGAYIIRHG